MPLTFVVGGWGFGVGESICCVWVLGVGVLLLAFCHEIYCLLSLSVPMCSKLHDCNELHCGILTCLINSWSDILFCSAVYHILHNIVDNALDMAGDWINQVNAAISAASKIPETMPMTLDNLAYVVYSSGTTGKPKGIKKSNADTQLSSNSVNIRIWT